MVRCRNEKQPLERNKKYYRIGYSIAATVAIFIIGFWIANNISSSDINISAPMNDKLAVMLPDSSEVWLNAASQIRYHKSFLNNREIFLEKGEAFFKVKKAQGAPFRVYFRESRIEVTGTEFNIKAGHMESEITLFTGSINSGRGRTARTADATERTNRIQYPGQISCTHEYRYQRV